MNENDPATDIETRESLGQRLRRQREQAGLSLDDVNQLTRIPLTKLNALEGDDFISLGDSVYALGYIRAYAKAVGDSSDECVSLYKTLTASSGNDSGDTLEGEANNRAAEISRSDAPVYVKKKLPKALVFTSVAVLFVLLSLVLWFLLPSTGSDQTEEPVAKEAQNSEIAATEATAEQAAINTIEVPLNTDQQITEEAASQITANPTDESATGALVASDSIVSRAVEPEVATIAVAPTADQKPGSDSPSTGDALLEISLIDECWIEVTDKNGRVVFADLRKSGDNLRLFGQAPFEIMFGNVVAVSQVTLNSEPIKVTPVGTRKTLRLTAGQP